MANSLDQEKNSGRLAEREVAQLGQREWSPETVRGLSLPVATISGMLIFILGALSCYLTHSQDLSLSPYSIYEQ